MLAIRMQRTGRKGHAMFRLVVQDSRLTPTSGKVVALLGNYDPHSKAAKVDSEKASFYLSHGAQPSDRAAHLLQKEGVKLPKWVKLSAEKNRGIRHPDKLRRNRPQEKADDTPVETVKETPADSSSEVPNKAAEEPSPEAADEAPAETPHDDTAPAEAADGGTAA